MSYIRFFFLVVILTLCFGLIGMIQRTASLNDNVFQVFHRRVIKSMRKALVEGPSHVDTQALGNVPSCLTFVATKQLKRLVEQLASFADTNATLFAPFYNRVITDIAGKEGLTLLKVKAQQAQ